MWRNSRTSPFISRCSTHQLQCKPNQLFVTIFVNNVEKPGFAFSSNAPWKKGQSASGMSPRARSVHVAHFALRASGLFLKRAFMHYKNYCIMHYYVCFHLYTLYAPLHLKTIAFLHISLLSVTSLYGGFYRFIGTMEWNISVDIELTEMIGDINVTAIMASMHETLYFYWIFSITLVKIA